MAETAVSAEAGRLPPPNLEGYAVKRSLGSGATGETFLAETPDGLAVALKVVDPQRGSVLPIAARLVDEQLHPSLARVLALGEDDQGRACLVLEHVDGKPLGARALQGLGLTGVLGVLRQVAEALQALHKAGAAHGNLKPGNVLVARDGDGMRAVVEDTGVLFRGGPDWESLGRRGLGYLAPERLRALVEKLDPPEPRPEEDVYAFLILAAETITGKTLFAGAETPDALLAAKEGRTYRFIGFTAGGAQADLRRLDDCLRRALASEPSDRPTSWDEILRALQPRA